MISKLIEQSSSICPENIQCKNKECNLMHPRCFAGICINNLNGKCKKTCPQNLNHIGKGNLKEKLQMISINRVFVINLCPKIDCKNNNCYYLHRNWISKRNICMKNLKNSDDCEGECENNQKHLDWEELRQEVLKEYEYENLSPEAITDVDKIQNSLEKYCLKYFKGISDYKGQCPKFHVDWEKIRNVSADQFERKKLIPCTRSSKPQLERMDSKSFKKLELNFEKQKLQKLQNDIKERNILDVVFIMDCTGSMKKWIDQARESISSIIDIFNKTVSQTQIRIAFVGYRDFKDVKHIQYHDFTTDVDLIKQFISTLEATGGDDDAEDVAGGIQQVLKLNFSKHSQSILCTFLICDAPTHGKQYHEDIVGDNHKDKIQDGSLEKLMQVLDQKKIPNNYFFCCKINDTTNKMFEIMKQNFKNLEISQLKTQDFANYVSLSMIKSFKQSSIIFLNNIQSKPQRFQAHLIWHKAIEPVECNNKNLLNYFSNFLTQMGKNQVGGDTILEIEMNQKVLNSKDQGMVSYIFEAFDIRNNLKVIIKLPKKVVDLYQNKKGQIDENYIQNAQKASLSDIIKLQQQNNQVVHTDQKLGRTIKHLQFFMQLLQNIHFVRNSWDQQIFMQKPIQILMALGKRFLIILITWINRKKIIQLLVILHIITRIKSLVITDLQGKQRVLSDPCIHTKYDIGYLRDETNQEMLGIETFFQTQHSQCNDICKSLELKRNCDDDDDKIPQTTKFLQLKQLNIQNVNAVCNVCSDIFQIKYEDYKSQIDTAYTCKSCLEINEFTEICECCGSDFKFNLNRVLKQALDLKICDQCQKDCLDQLCNECAQILQKQIIFCENCKKKQQCYYCRSKCSRRTVKQKLMLLMENQSTYVRKHVNFLKTYFVFNAYQSFLIKVDPLRRSMLKESIYAINVKKNELIIILHINNQYFHIYSIQSNKLN
ncbi:unnamed protein product [Paramecium pentaurelia]|uniref:VWFA domain-containing protein n=1 Tax=Paramecium pentaurelia TaxID=43138 RepID=A0A8S1XP76_9CILI|nr:unnamed protein product [Paramecium pentaurelia]